MRSQLILKVILFPTILATRKFIRQHFTYFCVEKKKNKTCANNAIMYKKVDIITIVSHYD